MTIRSGFILVILSICALFADGSRVGSLNREQDTERLRASLSDMNDIYRELEQRRALKDYEEKGADIARWRDDGSMVKPDNAALLYYRALAHRPQADPCVAEMLRTVMQGGEPDRRLRTYLGQCLPTIELTHLAGQIADGDWGFQYYQRPREVLDTLGLLRQLAFLLDVHVRTLAADGHYRAALENCLVMRQLARHLGDDIYVQYAISRGVDYRALSDVLHVVGRMPADAETLLWLRGQLTVSEGTPWRPHQALDRWRDMELERWHMREGDRVFDRQWALDQLENEEERKKAATLTDRQLLIRFLQAEQMLGESRYRLAVPSDVLGQARRECDEFLDEAITVMDADMSYGRKEDKLEQLENELGHRRRQCEPISILLDAPQSAGAYYRLMVRNKVFLNGAMTAIDICLTKARTGALPEKLPDDVPEDPFTGKDFEYERTEEGFVLRFDPENLSEIRDRQFEFTVTRP